MMTISITATAQEVNMIKISITTPATEEMNMIKPRIIVTGATGLLVRPNCAAIAFTDPRRMPEALEKELKQRLDVQEAAIVTILQRVMDIIDPPALPPPPSKPRIGFRP